MADGPRIAVWAAKLEAALVGGDNSSGTIFISLILRCSNYAASDWYCRFSPLRPFSLACNSYLLDVTDGNWSLLVHTTRCGETSLV